MARDHGLRTAWSDKHPAYQILSGPSGTGVQGYFTPEINSQVIGFPAGEDWTSDNAATMQYDSYKVQAVLNEIDGFDHSGKTRVGVPAIFGMNFQTVSTVQKLPTSDGLAGSTTIVISAKHGQSPTDPDDLARVPDSPIIAAIDAAWKAAHPGAGTLVAFSTDDDVMQLWLSDRSQAAAAFVKNYLLTHPAAGNNIGGSAITVQASGLKAVYARLLPGLQGGRVIGTPVETAQIAPAILALLGLDPDQLQAVQIEHTRVLPGLGA